VRRSPNAIAPQVCGTVPPALLPGQADGNDGARVAACGNASNGNPLRNDDAATAAVTGKADNAGQENNDCGSNDRYDDRDEDKWGRGALFNLSSSLSSLVIDHLVSDAITMAGLLPLGIAVPRIDI
jgi:hypothetical protein